MLSQISCHNQVVCLSLDLLLAIPPNLVKFALLIDKLNLIAFLYVPHAWISIGVEFQFTGSFFAHSDYVGFVWLRELVH